MNEDKDDDDADGDVDENEDDAAAAADDDDADGRDDGGKCQTLELQNRFGINNATPALPAPLFLYCQPVSHT